MGGTGRYTGLLTLDAGLTLTGDTTMTGDLTVGGTVTAQEFHAEYVSSSIIYESGSTKFGDSIDDVHQRSGSMYMSGALYIEGNIEGTTGNTFIGNSAGGYIELKSNHAEYGVIIRDYNSSAWGNIDANSGYMAIGYENHNGPLFISSTNVGIGITNPSTDLHIYDADASLLIDDTTIQSGATESDLLVLKYTANAESSNGQYDATKPAGGIIFKRD